MDLSDAMVQSPTTLISESPFHDHQNPLGIVTNTSGMNSASLQSLGHQESPRQENGPVRRRRASKVDAVLKRSASTPNVRSSLPHDTPSSMLNDKKRNKLGYHRTSVACVHCRRRKIRCLLAPDDPQGRCANCIRLKKDCQFYPVDQQPPVERRPRAGSKADIKSSGNSSGSSSPGAFTVGTSSEYVENFNTYQTAQGVTAYSLGNHSNESATFSPPGSAAPYNTSFDFSAHRNWDQQNHHYDQAYPHDDQRRAYWGQPEAPVSPAYPYPVMPSTDSIAHAHPMRSMSYSQVENLAHDHDPYHNQAPLFSHDQHQRRATNASDMLPPSLRHSASSSMVSINEAIPSTYAGTPATLAQTGGNAYAWSSPATSHLSQTPKAMEIGAAPWQYGEQQPLAKVQEEQENQMHYIAEPAVLYSSASHQ